jgi:hypothetical protein
VQVRVTGVVIEDGRILLLNQDTDTGRSSSLPGNGTHVVHLTFETRRIGGTAGQVTAGLDTRPIRGVEFVKLADLPSLGFSERFGELAMAGFPVPAATWDPRPPSACEAPVPGSATRRSRRAAAAGAARRAGDVTIIGNAGSARWPSRYCCVPGRIRAAGRRNAIQ